MQSQVAAIYRADRQTAGERCVNQVQLGGGGCGQPGALAAGWVGLRRGADQSGWMGRGD